MVMMLMVMMVMVIMTELLMMTLMCIGFTRQAMVITMYTYSQCIFVGVSALACFSALARDHLVTQKHEQWENSSKILNGTF